MDGQDIPICKYNQTGFFKYRENCKNTHVNATCAYRPSVTKKCKKIYPQDYRKYKNNNVCMDKKECAFRHVNENDLIIKNDEMAEDVKNLKSEVDLLKKHCKLSQFNNTRGRGDREVNS